MSHFLLILLGITLAPQARAILTPGCLGSVEHAGRSRVAFVVAPVSSGNQIAPELTRRGFEVFYIQPDLRVPDRVERGLRPGDFANETLRTLPGSVADALVSRNYGATLTAMRYLRELFPTEGPDDFLIVPGAESGVTWAGKLSASLGLPGSAESRALSSLRFKPHLYAALVRAGIRVIPYLYTARPAQAAEWIRANRARWQRELVNARGTPLWDGRFLVKPGNGHGSTQVKIVDSVEAVESAVVELSASDNAYGIPNGGAVVMPFLTNVDELAVNGACRKKEHAPLRIKITDVWKYERPRPPAYGFERILSWEEIPKGLLDFHRSVLQALRYERGFFHFEYFVDRETGEIFLTVEGGARPYGAGDTDMSAECTGYGQIEAGIDSLADEALFDARAETPYRLLKRGIVVNVSGPSALEAAGRVLVADHGHWAAIRARWADNIFKLLPLVPEGEPVAETSSLVDTLATVKLTAPVSATAEPTLLRIKDEIELARARGLFWRDAP